MASMSKDKNGNRSIQFIASDGKRRTIRLGKQTQKAALAIKTKIEALNVAVVSQTTLDREVADWIARLDTVLYDKLSAVKLLPERLERAKTALGPFLDAYIQSRSDIKSSTRDHLERAKRNLVEYFGASKPLRDITAGDADEFRLHLSRTMGDNTVRRVCGRAKQFFRAAVRKKLIPQSPFGDMRDTSVRGNKSRDFFLNRADAAKVLTACPDIDWRLIFVLSRFGGLRCPSEHLGLTWADIDWGRSRMRVKSPKTEHHEDREFRWVPLFPEVRKELDTAWELVPEGTAAQAPVITRYRSAKQNLRTTFERIIERAGLKPWPKLFQNLRSTRETELAEKFPIHVVCAWIGNTQAVATKHYLQVTAEHFERAIEALHNPVQSAAVLARTEQEFETSTPEITEENEDLLVGTASSAPRLGLEPRT
jgi:integrase